MWGKNCLNVGVFLVMVFVLFSCKKDPVDLGFEVNADDPITFVWNDSGGKTFTVTSNSGWYIYMAGQESWCQALISEGKRGHDQVVTLKVNSENSYITEREMELYVRNEEGDILTVKVMQEGNPTSSGAFVISDRVFHEYCLDEFDTDKDGKLSVGEAAAVKTIDVSDLRIRSMIDLTSFPALDTLRCNEMMELKKLIRHLPDDSFHDDLFLQHRFLLHGTRCQPTRENILGRFRLGADERHHGRVEYFRGHEDRANPCRHSRRRRYDFLPDIHGLRHDDIPK